MEASFCIDAVEEALARHGWPQIFNTGRYIAFYNARRPHAALDGRTPAQAYSHPLPLRTAA
jgi:transposase InsO family protein